MKLKTKSYYQISKWEIKGPSETLEPGNYRLGKLAPDCVEMDKDIQKRILEVSKFDDEDRKNIFSVIDAFIAKRKIQSII